MDMMNKSNDDDLLNRAWKKYKSSPGYLDGSLRAAFYAGWNHANDMANINQNGQKSVPNNAVERLKTLSGPTADAGYLSTLRETAGEKLGATKKK